MRVRVSHCTPLILLSILPVSVSAQGRYSLYVRSALEADKRPTIRLTATVPYANLVFKKSPDGNGFSSTYQVYVRILDKDRDNVLQTSVLSETVEAKSYPMTRSDKHLSKTSRSFVVEPGDYVVETSLRIKGTHLAYPKEAEVNVPDFFEGGVAVSKPRPYAGPVNRSRPFAIRRVTEFDPTLQQREEAVYAELNRQPVFEFDVFLKERITHPVAGYVLYEVTADDGSQVYYGRKRISLAGYNDQFVVFVDVDDWTTGAYELHVKAELEDPARESVATQEFSVEFNRLMLYSRFDDTLEILALIGTPDEIAALRAAPEDERADAWAEFWDKRDPSPGTLTNETMNEYFRRVRFAIDNFSQAGPGWRSDRGKVFIQHGEPDEVDTRTDPYLEGHYLIWRYNDPPMTFVFYDRFGLGEYTLTSSDTAF